MEMQTVKFYQTGTFTVGNRLLATEERSVQANMQRPNSLNSGHRACQGCGEALGARYAWTTYLKKDPAKLQFKVTWIGFWFNIPGVTADPTHNKLPPNPGSIGSSAKGANFLPAYNWVGGAVLDGLARGDAPLG